MPLNSPSTSKTCKKNWRGWSSGWKRRELRSQSSANTSRWYVYYQSSYQDAIPDGKQVLLYLLNWKVGILINSVPVSQICCFLNLWLPPRSISWQAANRAAKDPQPKTRTGRSLLLRLSIKETKAGPLSATCSFSEMLRSSETDWHKMTSHGNHDVAGVGGQALIRPLFKQLWNIYFYNNSNKDE